MSTSKKDYEEIAGILETYSGLTPEEGDIKAIARDLADYFEADNPLFDRERFLMAAGASAMITINAPPDS